MKNIKEDLPLSIQGDRVLSTFLDLLDRELKSKYLIFSILNKGRNEESLYRETLLKLISIYLRSNIHTTFIPSSITKFSDEIHKDTNLRELMIEVIDKLYVLLGKEEIQIFCKNLCDNLKDFHDGEDAEYAGPKQYIMSLYFNPETMYVKAIMKNHWLFFIMLLTLTFDKSEHFNNFDKL